MIPENQIPLGRRIICIIITLVVVLAQPIAVLSVVGAEEKKSTVDDQPPSNLDQLFSNLPTERYSSFLAQSKKQPTNDFDRITPNENNRRSFEVNQSVSSSSDGPTRIEWKTPPPQKISPSESFTLEVSGHSDGDGRVCLYADTGVLLGGQEPRPRYGARRCKQISSGDFELSFTFASPVKATILEKPNNFAIDGNNNIQFWAKLEDSRDLLEFGETVRTPKRRLQVTQSPVTVTDFPYSKTTQVWIPSAPPNVQKWDWMSVTIDRESLPQTNKYRVRLTIENIGENPGFTFSEELDGYPNSQVIGFYNKSNVEIKRIESRVNGQTRTVETTSEILTIVDLASTIASIPSGGLTGLVKELIKGFAEDVAFEFLEKNTILGNALRWLDPSQTPAQKWSKDDTKYLQVDFSESNALIGEEVSEVSEYTLIMDVKVTSQDDSAIVLLPDMRGKMSHRGKLGYTNYYILEHRRKYTVPLPTSNSAPVPRLNIESSSANIDEIITLDASNSEDPDGQIEEYMWDFDNDGSFDQTTKRPVITHTYGTVGQQTIQVRVADNEGANAKTSETISITDPTDDLPTPTDPSPEDTADSLNYAPTLSWNLDSAKSVSYRVYFGTKSNPSFYTTTSSPSVDVTGLKPGTTYYWRVGIVKNGVEKKGPIWQFTTAEDSGSISLSNIEIKHDNDDSTVLVGQDEGFIEYDVSIDAPEGVEDYDIRVYDPDRGITVGTNEDSHDDSGAVNLGLEEDTLFRKSGTKRFKIIAYHHASGDKFVTTASVDVKKRSSSDEMMISPRNPRPSETVTADVSHLKEDSGKTAIEGYEWTVFRFKNDQFQEQVVSKSGNNLNSITFTPDDTGEYEITASDTADVNGYNIDEESIFIKEAGYYGPDLQIQEFDVPDTTTGSSFDTSVVLRNYGLDPAHYLIRYKIDGTIVEVDAGDLNPRDADENFNEDSIPRDFSLSPGEHTVSIQIIDGHNNKLNERSETITVKTKPPNDPPVITSQNVSPQTGTVDNTFSYSVEATDADSDSVQVQLEILSPTNNNWKTISQKSIAGSGDVIWNIKPFQSNAESHRSKFRIRYDDGNGHSGIWGPFPGPKLIDDDDTGPSFSKWRYPDSVTTEESVRIQVGISDQKSNIASAKVNYTYPNGRSGTVQMHQTDQSWEATIPSPKAENAGESLSFRVIAQDTDDSTETAQSIRKTISIRENSKPKAALSDIPSTLDQNETIELDASNSTDPDGSIIKYAWDLNNDGDFERIAGQNLTYAFNTTGKKTIHLRVTDDNGATDTTTADITISNKKSTIASFNYSPQKPNVSETVTFDAVDSSDPDGTILSYEWDFDGDGTIDTTGQSTTHTFTTSGNHTVSLTVTDDARNTDTVTKTVSVAASDTKQDQFSFEKGAIGNQRPSGPMYLFNDAGLHRITDERASEGSRSFHTADAPLGDPSAIAIDRNLSNIKTILVDIYAKKNSPGWGNIRISLDGAGYGNEKENILGFPGIVRDRTDGDGYGGEGRWFRDIKVNVSQFKGSHTVTFWVDGDNNAYWDNIRFNKSNTESSNLPPTANFVSFPTDPVAGQKIIFNGSTSSDSDGTITTYEWDFNGDGTIDTTTSGPLTSHIFTEAGEYDVTLTVGDDVGAHDNFSQTITVESTNTAPTVSKILVTPSDPTVAETVEFTVNASDPDGDELTYEWVFGDGSQGSGNPAFHRYATSGIYNVSVTVIDTNNVTTTHAETITIEKAVATGLSLTANGTTVDEEASTATIAMTLTNTGTEATTGSTLRLSDLPAGWTIDTVDSDGGTANIEGTEILYLSVESGAVRTPTWTLGLPDNTSPGKYTMTGHLIQDGKTTQSVNITVTVENENTPPVIADIAWTPSDPTTDESITFTANASDPDRGGLKYEWSFGDGSRNAGNPTIHSYTTAGEYTVAVTVTDDQGATTNYSEVISIDKPVMTNLSVSAGTTTIDQEATTTNVTVTLNNTGGESVGFPAVTLGNLPTEWSIDRVQSDGGTPSRDQTQIIYDELAAGSQRTPTWTLTLPSTVSPGTYTATVNLLVGGEQIQTTTATITVEEGGISVGLAPTTTTERLGTTTRVAVELHDFDNGVGTYEFNATVNETSVATISNIELVGASADDLGVDVTIASDGSKASVTVPQGNHDNGVIARLTLETQAAGAAQITVSDLLIGDRNFTQYQIAKTTSAVVQVSERTAPPPVIGSRQPTDPDGDGQFEDITGDGRVNILDVGAFLQSRQSDTVQNNIEAFDFTGDSAVNILDVGKLLQQVVGG